ncbi:Sec-independent protein translocase protein TatB [Larsenimonas rhizosphaerae]|uniref:Sec-independent protein translocase protein TatB n=1 Tax=Larsenimonas rhizosphaerae TaxID=2944682 RepID=A0AA41ZFL2_9GAMM|nr:Sec-independent protein translocase protein TatB [Larsenimonas rhizosphaerae]MCM2129690.1 Sec-independent protein translocase protein TatB [Larsenimonas rhizosphaerae]MCX2524349.1 Sec-independent protein translocase protein TatB [Larsenimonas rhizosphaerae]
MFDVGFFELMVIGVIALLVLGPERLPTAARTAGLWIGRIKRTISSVQQDISSQLEAEELRRKMKAHEDSLNEGFDKVRKGAESLGHYEGPSSRPTDTASRHPSAVAETSTALSDHKDDSTS